MANSKGLVLLDASVLEASYLRPLLQGETCRDVRAITDQGYTPAVLQKSLAEVWGHAKLGGGNAERWAGDCADFPGSLERIVSTIQRLEASVDARRTAWLWFDISEEWRDSAVHLDAARQEFLAWRESIEAFCRRIEAALIAQGVEIVWPSAHLQSPLERQKVASLERDLALHSLLPNEDAAWILDAIIVKARAVVTCDTGVTECGRLLLALT